LETQTNEFMMDALDYYSNQEEIKNIDNLDDEQRERLEDEIENDNEEFQAIDAEDEIIDAEGMYDLYTVYDLDKVKDPDIII
jgi:hypothetical protein